MLHVMRQHLLHLLVEGAAHNRGAAGADLLLVGATLALTDLEAIVAHGVQMPVDRPFAIRPRRFGEL